MGFEPTQAKRIGSAVNRFNLSATLPNQSLFNDKLNRNKKKWSKDASLQIEIFSNAQNKKPVKSNHYSIKDRLEFCLFERYWRIKLSSPRTRLVQVVFQTKSFRWNFKFFKATC